MANLSRKALKKEIWNVLPDKCTDIMSNIKDSYIDMMMADIDSYCNGEFLKHLKQKYSCTDGIVSIEYASTKKRQLKMTTWKESMMFKDYIEIENYLEKLELRKP